MDFLGPILDIWHWFENNIEAVLSWLGDLTGNGGVAIVLFTIIIKTLLLPLTVKSVRSTAAMQELQPKIKELQKKYGKDRQRVSQETMKLYSEYGVNPAGGCLPMLIQMPIFFALFFSIRELSNSGQGPWAQPFLWINDLAEPDKVNLIFFTIVPLALVAGVFQFVQMRMMRPANQGKVRDPQQAMMQTMMNFMPLMVVIFGWNFPAGVVLYWVVQSLYSVIQQWLINGWGGMLDWFPWLPELPEHRRLGGKRELEKKVVVDGEQARPGGIMGWMQRMTDSMESKQQARESAKASQSNSSSKADQSLEPDIVEPDIELDDGVVVVSGTSRAKRQGHNRRRRSKGVSGGSGQDDRDKK